MSCCSSIRRRAKGKRLGRDVEVKRALEPLRIVEEAMLILLRLVLLVLLLLLLLFLVGCGMCIFVGVFTKYPRDFRTTAKCSLIIATDS